MQIAYLGLIICRSVNATPKTMQTTPTEIYALPRKLFFPPITETVEITMDLVPAKLATLKAIIQFIQKKDIKQ